MHPPQGAEPRLASLNRWKAGEFDALPDELNAWEKSIAEDPESESKKKEMYDIFRRGAQNPADIKNISNAELEKLRLAAAIGREILRLEKSVGQENAEIPNDEIQTAKPRGYWDTPANRTLRDQKFLDETAERPKRVDAAYSRDRFRPGADTKSSIVEQPRRRRAPLTKEQREALRLRNLKDTVARIRALVSLKKEKRKVQDRLAAVNSQRVQRMRTIDPRLKDLKRKKETDDAGKPMEISPQERIRRITMLLRAGVYDTNRAQQLFESEGDTVDVKMMRAGGTVEMVRVAKKDLKMWLDSLLPHEQKRLYVIGRKHIDFKFNPNEYPRWKIREGDSENVKNFKLNKLLREEEFQKDQKRLADALEVVSLPMLRAVFASLDQKVDVYLTSANDDIAGGLDIAIEFKKEDGTPKQFPDGSPMRFVIDVTYARMWDKIDKDLTRGRISEAAYKVLKGNKKEVPEALSNARAMKLFRTIVETLGGTMSTQTFDKKGPLTPPQAHIPRLIVGLDWFNAFSAIADWVEQGDEFEEKFKDTELADLIKRSIQNQLMGLYALTSRGRPNSNAPYLKALLDELNFKVSEGQLDAKDESLANIDQLLTLDADPLKARERNLLYRAALVQVEQDRARGGGHVRGDIGSSRETALTTGATRVEPKRAVRTASRDRRPAETVASADDGLFHITRRLELLELRRIIAQLRARE